MRESIGIGGRYFTRKHPGLFVFAADVNGLNFFEITGGLGADGLGAANSTVLTVTRGGVVYRGFVKRVYGTSDPSVNHLIIVADNGSASHDFSTDTNSDYHRLSNLSDVNRLYYLLYASSGGAYISNAQTQLIMEAFLDSVLKGKAWMTMSPASGSVPAAGSTQMAIAATTDGLSAGSYQGTLQFSSNSTTALQPSVLATLNVLPGVQRFEWGPIPALQQVNTPFNGTLTAKDASGNTSTSYQGRAMINFATETVATTGAGLVTNNQLLVASNETARTQAIYTPQEIGAAGLLSRLAFEITSAPGLLDQFTVRLKHSPKVNYVSNATWESSGWTTAFTGTLNAAAAGWHSLDFQNVFAYDGVSPLMVDISFQNISVVASGIIKATAVSPSRVINNSGSASPLTWSGSIPSAVLSANLPNLRFTKKYIQPGNPSEVTFVNGVWTGLLTSALSFGEVFVEAIHPVRPGVSGRSNALQMTRLGALSLSIPASVSESTAPFTGSVMASVAPETNLTVQLFSSQPSVASLPATVVIPAGQTSVSFLISVEDDDLLDGPVNVSFSAGAPAYDSALSQMTIQDDETATLSLTLPPTLTEGQSTSSGQAIVHLAQAALIDVTVSLQSSLPEYVTVPASVTIPAGQTNAGFTLNAPQNSKIEDLHQIEITASYSDAVPATASLNVLDDENRNLQMALNYSALREDGAAVNSAGYVSISGTLTAPLVVTLMSDDTSELTINQTITIPAGSTISPAFTLTPVNDTDFDGSQTVTLTAAAEGFSQVGRTIIVRDDEVHHFGVSMTSNKQVKNRPFNVTFTAQDVNNVTVTNYSGTPTLTAMNGEVALPLTPTSLTAFSSGVKTQSMTISEFASQAALSVSDSTLGISGTSQPFSVGSGPAVSFVWSTIASGLPSGVPFPVTITARDGEGNNATDFNGNADLSLASGVTIGSAGTTWSLPLYTYYHDARTQSIYTAAELGGARTFNSLSLHVNTLPGQSLNAFSIRLKHTTKNDFSSSAAWESSGWTVCHLSSQNISSSGWVKFPFSQTFSYNGTDHLMIDISFNNTFYTSYGSVYATQTSTPRSIYAYSDSGQGDPLSWSGLSPSAITSVLRPDIRLGELNQVQISPANTGSFSTGVWTGNIALSAVVTDQRLRAASGSAVGDSNVFSSGTPLLAMELPDFISEGQGTFTGELGLTAQSGSSVSLNITSSDPALIQPTSSTVNLPAGQKTLPLSFNISNDEVKSGTRHVTLTLSAAGFSTINAVIEVRDDELETLTMEAIPSPQIKNGPIPVILTARNAEGHIITSFQGTPSLTGFDGPRSLALSIAQTSGFVQGVATIQALIDDYATAAVITARQGEVEASSNVFEIGAGAVARFRWSTPGPLQITGVGFPVSLSAEDAYGNIRSDYSGTARLEAVAQSVDIGTADSSTDLLFAGGRTQSRTQQIFHASELAQAGRIVSLTLNVLPTTGTSTYQNFTIRMKHTDSMGYDTAAQSLWEYVGFTTVFQSAVLINQSGPLKLQFTTPFDYDGLSNLMIDFSFNGMTGGTREVVATARSAPYRTLSYQSSSSGDPLLWSGNLPAATSSDTTADLKVDFAPNQSISPKETEAFENGLWSGTIAVGQASPALVLLAKDDNTGGIGASNVLRVIPSQIPLAPEPVITGGTTNRLYWEEPDSTGIEYELQRDITPEFLNPVSTGYITATSHLQTGLTDGQLYYYRLRVRGSGGTSWVGDWSEPVQSLQDATPPTIRLNERSLITTTSAAVISGTAADNNGIKEIYIEQGTPVTPLPNSDHWSHTHTNLPYGTSDILVQARDQADPPNLASLVVKVHRVMNAEGTGEPVFQQGPRSQWGTLGQPVEWLAAVQGARPMRYEWTRGGKVLPGLNDAEWTIPAVKISDVEGYSVTAANQLGETAPSATAWLGVVTPTATPRVSLKTYDTLKLQCSAVVPKGAETIYRWKKGSSNLSDGLLPSGATISGANTAKLTISQITVAEAGNYTCQVTMRASGNPSITNGNTEVSIATALPVITSTPVPAELWVSQSVHGYLTASHNPTQFIVKNLPKGLKLDPATGLITGRLTTPSKIDSRTRLPIPYQISFSAKNAIGPGPVMVVSLIVKDHLGNLAGNYDGLVERDAGSNFRLGGSLKMTVAKTGAATGSFSLAGQRYTFVQPLEPELDEEGGLTGKAVLDFSLSRPKPKGLGPLSIRLWISEDASSITDGWIEDLQVQKLQNTKNYGLAIMPGVADDAQAGVSIARFRLPAGLAVDSDGLVYVADSGNHTIRIMRPSYGLPLFVSTLAGTAGARGSQDGTIPRFDTPRALTLGPDHALYIIDQGSRLIRRLDNGIATTLAGSAVWTETINGLGDQAGFKSPHAICADPSGNLYVTDDQSHVIRKITPAGQVTTLAGTANVKGYVNASGAKARFNGPRGIVYDAFHKALFVTDGDKFIRRVSLTGAVSTWSDRLNMPRALSPDGRGALYVLTEYGIHRISADKIIHALRDHDDDQSVEASSLVFLPQTNTLLLSSAHEIQELSFNPQRLSESNIRLLRAVKPGYARTAGNYNAHWNTLTPDAAVGIPANHASGYLHIKVQSNGLVNSAGRTMDGASITHSCLMNDQGEWNLHQTLYSGAGSFQGSLKIIDDSLEETTDFSWRRNDPGLFMLPHSYETDVSLFISRIEFPGDLHRQLGLTELPSSVLLQTEGRNSEANFEGMLSLNAPSKWKIPSSLSSKPTSLKFSVDPKTGVFSGSYTDATTRKKVSFGGIFTKLNSLASNSEGIGFALIPVRDENGVEKISLDAIHIKKPEAD